VESFWKSEAIQLEKGAIRYNAAKRGLAKICLNSMWGILTHRNDRTKTKSTTEPKELYGLLANIGVEVMNPAFASDDVLLISWKFRAEEDVPSLRHTNREILAYVTARVKNPFCRYIQPLRENAMFYDTISVI